MASNDPTPELASVLADVLGYLNFSGGAVDARFRTNLNWLFSLVESLPEGRERPWEQVGSLLQSRLEELRGSTDAFADVTQAEAVVRLAFGPLLTAYREFHRDLLFHQDDASLWRPFFLARACEAILRQGGPWNEDDRLIQGALDELNDFVGYRPVAVLNTPQKVEPYDHEWVAPIPLYFKGAGVATGKYHALVALAIEILGQTDPDILAAAWFDLDQLEELSLDPRAYDFDHPVNQRPVHHFGQWDPGQIDTKGRYRRFVLHGVTLEATWERTVQDSDIPADERLYEAGAALASTILMAAAMGGRGPETHDSTTTLATLLPRIAACRDAFYSRTLERITGPHGERLRAEAETLHQPLAGARQHLNQRLARLRATQLQHVHLAQLFARMGYPEASTRQSQIVPVASARLLCEINGRLTAAHHAIDHGRFDEASETLPAIDDLVHRAIECGALVDPWNILGFQGQFSLFPAVENTVRDHRVDVLVHLMREVFALGARLESECAARGERECQRRAAEATARLARWWDKFASVEVSSIERLSGRESIESSRDVAFALEAWHEAGEAAGDVGFWRQHVGTFQSAKAYALVIDILLDQRDIVASRALLMQWLSQGETIPLADGAYSFHTLAWRWLKLLVRTAREEHPDLRIAAESAWPEIVKFFGYAEANAEERWEVPDLLLDDVRPADEDREDDESGLYGAAYDDVVYRDTTGGAEGDMLEGGGPPPSDDPDAMLEIEATRIESRLQFLSTLARLWKSAAIATAPAADDPHRRQALLAWHAQARHNHERLERLLATVAQHRLAEPRGTHESLVEFDRRRGVKESLMVEIIDTIVETSDAALTALAVAGDETSWPAELSDWQKSAIRLLGAMYRQDVDAARAAFPDLKDKLLTQPILYVPLTKRGDPRAMASAKGIQQVIKTLLRGLPRIGLIAESCQLIAVAQDMEQNRPEGEGVVTEFDRVFEVGYLAIVDTLVAVAASHPTEHVSAADIELIDALQQLSESLLKRWLDHSHSLRLSVLEKVLDAKRWDALVKFIENYGRDLFTQRFMNAGNLRAILRQSPETYLRRLEEEETHELRLLEDLDRVVARNEAAEHLGLAIEAVLENYGEYKDFNNTTTQSDHGELLYTLLDVLRLKTSYDRVAWNIRPVILAHEVLARRGNLAAAELWRRAVAERTSEAADWHLRRLDELTKKYGIRLSTVADRFKERFIRPLAVDRMRALVAPAMLDARRGQSSGSFELLELEISEFTEHPTGAGLDVPAWLESLEDEAERAFSRWKQDGEVDDTPSLIPGLDWQQVLVSLRSWEQPSAE